MRRRFGALGAAITVWQVAMALREHWVSIPRAKRERARALVAQAGLRPGHLSRAQRAELRRLVGEMELALLGRRLAGIAFAKRRSRRR